MPLLFANNSVIIFCFSVLVSQLLPGILVGTAGQLTVYPIEWIIQARGVALGLFQVARQVSDSFVVDSFALSHDLIT